MHLGHGAQAAQHFLARARLHGDAHVSLQPTIDHPLAQAYAVAGDDLGLFQSCQPRGDRGAGNAQVPGEHGHAFTGIDLQGGNKLSIDFVEGGEAGVWH
ncbi:hypothetical protein D3C80_1151600 [compost metagenome]